MAKEGGGGKGQGHKSLHLHLDNRQPILAEFYKEISLFGILGQYETTLLWMENEHRWQLFCIIFSTLKTFFSHLFTFKSLAVSEFLCFGLLSRFAI